MHTLLLLLTLGGASSIEGNRAATAVVDRAIAARNKVLAPLSFEIAGKISQLHQSRTPEGPYLETALDRRIVVDPSSRSVFMDETSVWPYFTSRTTTLIRNEEIVTVRHGSRSHSAAAGGAARRTSILRQHPDLVLDAASRRRASLRAIGPSTILFASEDGSVMTLTFRDDKLSFVDWVSYDALFGDVENRFAYEWVGGEPASFRYLENGRVVMQGRYREAARGPQVTLPTLDIPPDYAKPEAAPAAPVTLTPHGDRVWLIRNAGGADYHSLLVEFRDHFVVVEAPRSAATANAAIAAIRAHDAAKPIRAVVVTHHHDDHIGGLRAYAAIGAKILTTEGNVKYLRDVLSAAHTIERAPAVTPDVVAVPSGYRLTGEGQELVLYDAGPNEHVQESLIAWLPAQQIVFQGDLFRLDPAGAEPARPSAVAFAGFIRQQKLPVRHILGTHGEPARLSDLEAAIARRSP